MSPFSHSFILTVVYLFLFVHTSILNITITHTLKHWNAFFVVKIYLSYTITMAIICIESVALNKPFFECSHFIFHHFLESSIFTYLSIYHFFFSFWTALFCIESYSLWNMTYGIWHMTYGIWHMAIYSTVLCCISLTHLWTYLHVRHTYGLPVQSDSKKEMIRHGLSQGEWGTWLTNNRKVDR